MKKKGEKRKKRNHKKEKYISLRKGQKKTKKKKTSEPWPYSSHPKKTGRLSKHVGAPANPSYHCAKCQSEQAKKKRCQSELSTALAQTHTVGDACRRPGAGAGPKARWWRQSRQKHDVAVLSKASSWSPYSSGCALEGGGCSGYPWNAASASTSDSST